MTASISAKASPASDSDRAAELALRAFMSMDRAVAIVGPDGKLLQPNIVFARLFGDSELIDRINREAGAHNGKTDRQITLSDGRAFWVETIPMDGGWLVSAYDMTERSAKARTDTLTKLGNRLKFHEQLTELLVKPDRVPETAAVLVIDLDRFKAINESLGRDIGGGLLRLVAERIRAALGRDDIVARLGGDKFAIVQTGQPQPLSAAYLAGRLIDQIGRSYMVEGQLIDTDVCIGIALLPAGPTDSEQLLKNADLALHRAKSDGSGTCRFFEEAMDQKMQYRRNLEIDLRRALALGEFALVYEPQVNLRRNAVTGFEALLRWQSPTRGAVSPVEFIPVAEDTGIITSIGEWVLRTACREAAGWPGAHRISINVSAIQFKNPNLVTTILSALAESGLNSQRLELEITESVMLNAQGSALTMLQTLRGIGVRVALDDFGVGYSSLGYLRSFPFDRIKIDQSFVRGESNDAVGQAIVRAIATLGQSLGMATVAEGVETDEQLARIAADGCTDIQGYLVSRPMPPEQIEGFLSSRSESVARKGPGGIAIPDQRKRRKRAR
ncbi:MAG: bifunctional diguanylate cyclase/phosphodiesterase [Bradyrhizobium sp.]|nr:bifunctional diguanylate cyclase/phosphodiesterase [Bradyrhizobium sp.]